MEHGGLEPDNADQVFHLQARRWRLRWMIGRVGLGPPGLVGQVLGCAAARWRHKMACAIGVLAVVGTMKVVRRQNVTRQHNQPSDQFSPPPTSRWPVKARLWLRPAPSGASTYASSKRAITAAENAENIARAPVAALNDRCAAAAPSSGLGVRA